MRGGGIDEINCIDDACFYAGLRFSHFCGRINDGIAMLSNFSAASASLWGSADSTSPLATSQLSLKIARGRTGFPERPVQPGRFLIGAAAACDLRLGGVGIPALHSLIHNEAGGAWIDAIAPQPPLMVNGQPQHRYELHDGDLVAIGDFEFTVSQRPTEPNDDTNSPSDIDFEDAFEDGLGEGDDALCELTAEELVDRLQEEFELVDEFEERRELGAQALLQAISARKPAPESSPPDRKSATVPADERVGVVVPMEIAPALMAQLDPSLVEELNRVLKGLHEFSAHLEQRAAQLTHREQNYAAAASTLLDAQQKLTNQLDQLQQQIATLRELDGKRDRLDRAAA